MSTLAAPPIVKTVPWVATNPLIPHDTWKDKVITLKGTCDLQGANIKYIWDFGDGSPVAEGIVNNRYVVEARHAYAGLVGNTFTATLTVVNTATAESASKNYYVLLENKDLSTEVNVAIDEGLWYLHRTQNRSGQEGYWSGSGYNFGHSAANVNAFEVNGHLEGGPGENPYTETVSRGLRYVLSGLYPFAIANQSLGNPDGNGNSYGVGVNSGRPFYEGGMVMDAIIASGTPEAVAATGPSSPGPGILNRKYKDILQDMADYYAFAQYDDVRYGAWRYSVNEFPDNSASQWAAIGLIPAQRNWSCVVPAWVKTANIGWLGYSQQANGIYGYTSSSPLSGVPFGTTPAGMVQCAFDGVGRGNPLWDRAETYIRDNFGAPSVYWQFKNNYYGMFSFVKSMLLHDSNGDGVAEPLQLLKSSTANVPPIDWYAAETAAGAPTDGLARKIVDDQRKTLDSNFGRWSGNGWYDDYGHATAWAVIMLRRTLFESGAPVAVAKANPNPAVAGQIIQLDASDSFHQDSAKLIDSWEWDLDNNGTFETLGPFPTITFATVGEYTVKLRVSDNGNPEGFDDATLKILVSTPPIAPTAVAGGPYSFCEGAKPWFLDGTGSTNPDEGLSSPPTLPGDTIQAYEWDLDGDGQFDDASGPQPDVTAFFTGKGPGSYLIQLRVTDTTGTSFPTSQMGDLVDVDSAIVVVRPSDDPECACVDDLRARAKSGKIQLVWTYTGAHHCNIYRATKSGGPYLKIASTTSTYSTFLDYTAANNVTYYYVVREADLLDKEQCQSNEVSAKAVKR
ncbi:MAG: PKD domain-containing protein [Verrucomicrobiales bacterium]|nr:PKD domain-containing protein [Verrucomicrobiales bacterium]